MILATAARAARRAGLAAIATSSPTLLAVTLALALAGCASTAPRVEGGLWTGRLSVRSDALDDQPARSSSGQFELSGSAVRGQLVLASPLGTVAARASWSLGGPAGDRVELDTGGGPRRYATLDEMMVDATGEALPLVALFDWLDGRPWAGGASAPLGGGRRGFAQAGWEVDLSRFDDGRLLVADRARPAPALHVRVKLDAPAATPATGGSAPAAASVPASTAPPARAEGTR